MSKYKTPRSSASAAAAAATQPVQQSSEYPPIIIKYDGDIIEIQYLTNFSDIFINTSTIIYGPTNSNKTSIIKEIMYKTKNNFPLVIVYSPNHDSKGDFEKIVPLPLIYKNITIDDVNKFSIRQKTMANIYKQSNDSAKLGKLYDILKTSKDDENIEKIKKFFQDDSSLKEKKVLKYKKKVILNGKKKITDIELLKYYDMMAINPNLLVVFDDATTKLQEWLKLKDKDKKTVLDFFYQGRHIYVTLVYLVHSTVCFPPAIRQNAIINIFTAKTIASAWFGCGNNSDGITKKIANIVIREVFSKSRYHKLVYHANNDKFYYMVSKAELPEFMMCSENCQKMLSDIKKTPKF
jgi:hypothetical protein